MARNHGLSPVVLLRVEGDLNADWNDIVHLILNDKKTWSQEHCRTTSSF